MRNKNLVIKKSEMLQKKLNNLENFNVHDATEILQEKKTTVYWTLSNLTKLEYLKRVGNGLYTFLKKDKSPNPIISKSAKKIWQLLKETGYDFFISGLDILSIFMQHIPETYPVILFINKYSKEEIINLLIQKNYNLLLGKRNSLRFNGIHNNKIDIYVHLTTEFNYSDKNLASFEKAFVDIYYEVTRMNYPLSLQELVKIYLNMRRRLYLDMTRIIKIASTRHLQPEIRFIVENKKISKSAIEFVKLIKINE